MIRIEFSKNEVQTNLLKQADERIRELGSSYEAILIECERLNKLNSSIKQDYEYELKEAQMKV